MKASFQIINTKKGFEDQVSSQFETVPLSSSYYRTLPINAISINILMRKEEGTMYIAVMHRVHLIEVDG